MRKILLSILLLLIVGLSYGKKNDSYLLFEYLLDPVSTSLRNGNLAMSPTIYSTLSNPAGVGMLENRVLSFSYLSGFSDTYNNSIRGNYSIDSLNTLFGTFVYQNYGEFERIDNSSYNAYDTFIAMGYSRKMLKDLYLGSNLKYIYSSIEDYSSSAIAVDMNSYYTTMEGKLSFSMGIFNLGTQISKYKGKEDNLPTVFKTGISNRLDRMPLEVMLQFNRFIHSEINEYLVGAQFLPNDFLEIRAGYDFKMEDYEIGTGEKLEQFSGLSLGLGINYANMEFDLGFPLDGYLDNQISMALVYNFDKAFYTSKGDEVEEEDKTSTQKRKRRGRRK